MRNVYRRWVTFQEQVNLLVQLLYAVSSLLLIISLFVQTKILLSCITLYIPAHSSILAHECLVMIEFPRYHISLNNISSKPLKIITAETGRNKIRVRILAAKLLFWLRFLVVFHSISGKCSYSIVEKITNFSYEVLFNGIFMIFSYYLTPHILYS